MHAVFATTDLLCIAHRGARSLAPENTLASFELAARLGAHGVEADIRLSRDGEAVVFHDETMERTTDAPDRFPGQTPRVADLNHAELRSLDAGAWFAARDPFGQIAQGALSPADAAAFAGQRIPHCRELLALAARFGLFVNLELKPLATEEERRALVLQCRRAVRDTDMAGRVLLSSFDMRTLLLARELAPELPRAVLAEAAWKLSLSELERRVAQTGAVALHPEAGMLSDDDVRGLRGRGIVAIIWTVNESAALARTMAGGAAGIITDFPQRWEQARQEAAAGRGQEA